MTKPKSPSTRKYLVGPPSGHADCLPPINSPCVHVPRTSTRGRPPLPPSHRLDLIFKTRITAQDKIAIEKQAESEGMTASAWARSVLLRALR